MIMGYSSLWDTRWYRDTTHTRTGFCRREYLDSMETKNPPLYTARQSNYHNNHSNPPRNSMIHPSLSL